MSQLRVLNTSIFLLFIFIIQETVIARIHFPFNGFSLYIAALMVLLSLEDRAGSLVFGFVGGLVMDLSTSASTPFGQWALAMTFIGYIFSVNREILGDFIDGPLLFVLFVCASSAVSMATFLLIGVLLGQENGPFLRNIFLILANTFWTFLIIPIFLPLIIRIRKMLLTNRERV